MSEPARLAGVYLEPGKAFADIAARPQRWWVPLVIVALVSVTFVYSYSQRVGWEQLIRRDLETSSRGQNMPPEQREQAIVQGAKFAGAFGYVGAAVGAFVSALIMAGILMFVMNSMMGGQVRFAQSRGIVSYSFLVGVVSGILSIIIMYLKSPEDFDLRNPLAFNAGAFLPETAPKWLASLASSLDVFSFWTMALMAVGYAATSRKLTFSKAFTGILMAWGVWVVIKVGWTAMMG